MRNSKYYKQGLYKWLKRGTRWLIGIVIFYFVFQNIDFAELKMSIEKSNPWLFFLGLAHAPLFVIIAALRWRFLLMQYYKRRFPVEFVLNHYWKGLALSSFTPAFIGLDAYRFIISGRYFGEYTLNAAIILVEKLMALITCMSAKSAESPRSLRPSTNKSAGIPWKWISSMSSFRPRQASCDTCCRLRSVSTLP